MGGKSIPTIFCVMLILFLALQYYVGSKNTPVMFSCFGIFYFERSYCLVGSKKYTRDIFCVLLILFKLCNITRVVKSIPVMFVMPFSLCAIRCNMGSKKYTVMFVCYVIFTLSNPM